ncbi:MAG: hypothetical protein Kow0029_11980 [Candidatus Rifleibacteriota bacterium]
MNKRGFTLVEVIIVSALILLLSLTAFQTADIVNTREKEERLRISLLEMRAAIDRFQQNDHDGDNEHRFPLTINELLTNKDPNTGGFYLRRLPLNPFLGETKWDIASKTTLDGSSDHWEEISNPMQGMSDNTPIVDIRCSSTVGISLNGTPYKNW